MMNPKEVVPNERLRRVRMLKGWSQAELAEQVGTSFEMVSRWERGVTVPSPRYQKRLYAVLGKTAEELGLMRDLTDPFTPPPSPLVLLASSHADAEKAIVSHLKTTLQGRGIALWNSRGLPPRMARRRPSRASLIFQWKPSHLRTSQRRYTCRLSSQRNSSHHKARLRRDCLHLISPWNQPIRPGPCLPPCLGPQHRLSLAIE